jgi:putative (di)nucleoside polyphosphate hydrolase
MIDEQGYRCGVGIILVNANRQVFWGKRLGLDAWQFPQGGVREGETPEETMHRELHEEIGLQPADVRILAEAKEWLRYELPKNLIRRRSNPVCIGQKQKWFLLELMNKEAKIDLEASGDPEFDSWAWVSYWYPLKQIVLFKRKVYEEVMREFAPLVLSRRFREQGPNTS